MAIADQPEPGVRIVQSIRVESADLLKLTRANFGIVNQLVREVLAEVPDADFIEVRAIRYDVKEDTDERSVSPAPPE